ncbi:MAG: iron ABC transporter permease [Synergistaceae bacterium]|jgi:iron complex transport system permease protein|nr:iron ABC transporter permease [Synergistaceae bacterium]
MRHSGRYPLSLGYAGILCATLAAIVCGLYFGDVKMSLAELWDVLKLGPSAYPYEAFKYSVVWRIRMPRVIVSSISGAVLAASGVIFQAVLKNPLAEPYTLGVSSGAAFGASCAILAGLGWITTAAFLGCAAALAAVLFLGWSGVESDLSGIILAGVIVGNIFGAGMTLMKAVAGDKVAAIVFWLMGSFSAAGWRDVIPMLMALLVILSLCLTYYNELDVFASESDAASLGINVSRTRAILLAGASLAVSFVVSRFGVIGFVGLIIPHFLRLLFGPAHRSLLKMSLLAGAALLCTADTAAKIWNEMPAGVLTVLAGGPVFCFILWKRK